MNINKCKIKRKKIKRKKIKMNYINIIMILGIILNGCEDNKCTGGLVKIGSLDTRCPYNSSPVLKENKEPVVVSEGNSSYLVCECK